MPTICRIRGPWVNLLSEHSTAPEFVGFSGHAQNPRINGFWDWIRGSAWARPNQATETQSHSEKWVVFSESSSGPDQLRQPFTQTRARSHRDRGARVGSRRKALQAVWFGVERQGWLLRRPLGPWPCNSPVLEGPSWQGGRC